MEILAFRQSDARRQKVAMSRFAKQIATNYVAEKEKRERNTIRETSTKGGYQAISMKLRRSIMSPAAALKNSSPNVLGGVAEESVSFLGRAHTFVKRDISSLMLTPRGRSAKNILASPTAPSDERRPEKFGSEKSQGRFGGSRVNSTPCSTPRSGKQVQRAESTPDFLPAARAPLSEGAAHAADLTIHRVDVDAARPREEGSITTPNLRPLAGGLPHSGGPTTSTAAGMTDIREGEPLDLSLSLVSGDKTISASSSDLTPPSTARQPEELLACDDAPTLLSTPRPLAGSQAPHSAAGSSSRLSEGGQSEGEASQDSRTSRRIHEMMSGGGVKLTFRNLILTPSGASASSTPRSSTSTPRSSGARSISARFSFRSRSGTESTDGKRLSRRSLFGKQQFVPPTGGVSREEFTRWFKLEDEGFGNSLMPELALQVWDRAAQAARVQSGYRSQYMVSLVALFTQGGGSTQDRQLLPTWTHLREAMYSWPMPRGEQPGWLTHFVVCTQRYIYKRLRTRFHLYLLLLVTCCLGTLCGVLYGDDPPINDSLIFYLLFNTMFGSICATASIATFSGDVHFFSHEAASGIRQTAEGLARMLVDCVPLFLLVPCFTLPLYSFAAVRGDYLLPYVVFLWSLSPLGYIFTLAASGNATVFTSSTTFVLCAFGNGFFGIKRGALPANMRWALELSSGYPALMLIAYGSALAEPHSLRRWAIIRQLYYAGLTPMDGDKIANGESSDDVLYQDWARASVWNLVWIGLVLRCVTLILFSLRSTDLMGGAHKLHKIVRDQFGPRAPLRCISPAPPTSSAEDTPSRVSVTLGASRGTRSPLAPTLASPAPSDASKKGRVATRRNPRSPPHAVACSLDSESADADCIPISFRGRSSTLTPDDQHHSSTRMSLGDRCRRLCHRHSTSSATSNGSLAKGTASVKMDEGGRPRSATYSTPPRPCLPSPREHEASDSARPSDSNPVTPRATSSPADLTWMSRSSPPTEGRRSRIMSTAL